MHMQHTCVITIPYLHVYGRPSTAVFGHSLKAWYWQWTNRKSSSVNASKYTVAVSGACMHNNQSGDDDDGADMLVAIVFGLGLRVVAVIA